MDTSVVPEIPLDPDLLVSYLLRAELLLQISVTLDLLILFHDFGASAPRDVQPRGSVVSKVIQSAVLDARYQVPEQRVQV